MGRKGGTRKQNAISSLVRAEEAAEEEILETPALSSLASNDNHTGDNTDDDDEDDDEDEEAEIERQLVEEKLREEQEALNGGAVNAANKGVNNQEALLALVNDWDQGKQPLAWVETLETCKFPLDNINVHDDLKREVAFYNHTLASVRFAKNRLKQENIAYKRPDDYFAEMLKSDAHMAKVKDKLIYEQKKITAVEERKKSQAHRKVAKELQAEKTKQRLQQKKDTLDAVKQWKKRKAGDKGGLNDDDDQELDSIMNSGSSNKRKREDSGKGGDAKKPRVNRVREAKNKKYGFGGKKRFAKSNSSDSTNDMSAFPRRGGRGKPAAAVRAGAAKTKAPKAKRAGKSQRANQRNKSRR